MAVRLLNYSHFKVETAKLLKEDRTGKSGLSSNGLVLVVFDFEFLDSAHIIAYGIFLQVKELRNAEAIRLVQLIDHLTISTEFNKEAFESMVEIAIVHSRTDISFKLKCGLEFHEEVKLK